MEDTIAAIATALGEGGIGIIRISGDEALNIGNKIFSGKNCDNIGKKSRFLHYGHIVNPENNEIIDEVLLSYMKAPFTYTGEDVVEINCHGGVISLKKILNMVLNEECRLAEPGEFTKRAFLNGRIDLSQAEAVIDIIKAKTDKSFEVAVDQLQGGFSLKIDAIRKKLVDVLVNISVNIDYPDEDIEHITYETLKKSISEVLSDIKLLVDSGKAGKIIRDGVSVAIIGKPNVGKSSLMNNLLRESRSIVTEIAGTTRDTIEEYISIEGIPVRIIDTAGIRETEDLIEKIGIEKSKETFNNADYIIFIIDLSRPIDEEDNIILGNLNKDKTLFVFNKSDMEKVVSDDDIKNISENYPAVFVSMNEFENIREIEKKLYEMINVNNILSNDRTVVSNVRHENALKRACSNLEDSLKAIDNNMPLEFIEIDVSSSYENLGFITGDSVQQDIIDEVFSRFCLGK